jgi:hypothetical protein
MKIFKTNEIVLSYTCPWPQRVMSRLRSMAPFCPIFSPALYLDAINIQLLFQIKRCLHSRDFKRTDRQTDRLTYRHDEAYISIIIFERSNCVGIVQMIEIAYNDISFHNDLLISVASQLSKS